MLFLLLRAEFVAAVQVVVYAGAVMVLYVFVVAYVGGDERARCERRRARRRLALRCARVLARRAARRAADRAARHGLEAIDGYGAGYVRRASARRRYIGKLLLTRFLLPFEVASFLLLVAAVGGVVLARRRRGLDDEDERDVLAPMRPAAARRGTGTMAEGVGATASAQPLPATRTEAPAAAMSIAWYLAVSAIVRARRGRRDHAPQPARGAAVPGADAQRAATSR